MLRTLALALVLANLVFWAWSREMLADMGFAPVQQSEPQRLAQQIRPQDVELLSETQFKHLQAQSAAAEADTVEAFPLACWAAGPLDAAQGETLRKMLEASWPAGSWELRAVDLAPRWIVYRGGLGTPELVEKKRKELAALKIRTYPINDPALAQGLSLGSFASRAQAEAALEQLSSRGVHSIKVVQEVQAQGGFALRLPAVDAVLTSRLGEVRAVLAAKPLQSCTDAAAVAR